MISNTIFESISRDGLRKLNGSFKYFKNSSFLYSTNANLKANETKKELIKDDKKTSIINPLKHEDFFDLNKLVKLEELFK
jgi:hypothetical protein